MDRIGVDRIGIVIHGPEVVDSGKCLKALEYFESLGTLTAVMGGTMGRVAVIDSGLSDLIDISQSRSPSESIRDLQICSDLVVLLNQAKTIETGLAFGSMIASRIDPMPPVLQIDFIGFIAWLSGFSPDLSETIGRELKLDLKALPGSFESVSRLGCKITRKISGVLPGENISINGTIVARAKDGSVEIIAEDGVVLDVQGAIIKQHGLEKLSYPLDLEKAIIRSGSIRRTEAVCRPECHRDLPNHPDHLQKVDANQDHCHSAALIDHCAEKAFEIASGAHVAVTVGDDTTAIAADILLRRGTPVIGIVDGDTDEILKKTSRAEGSVIIRVEPGYDDRIGGIIKKDLFHGGNRARIQKPDLLERAIALAGDRIIDIERF